MGCPMGGYIFQNTKAWRPEARLSTRTGRKATGLRITHKDRTAPTLTRVSSRVYRPPHAWAGSAA